MSFLGRLALLFVIVPIVELVLLIQLGQVVGLLPTLALVIFTGVTGAWLARAEGVRVFFQFQRELASGRLPGQAMLDGISVLIGGAFLLTPGVMTDVVGFSLLFPPSRRWIQRRVRKRLERGITDGTIRVVTMGGEGGWGFGGRWSGPTEGTESPVGSDVDVDVASPPDDGPTRRSVESRGRDAARPLDPSKGIVIEPENE